MYFKITFYHFKLLKYLQPLGTAVVRGLLAKFLAGHLTLHHFLLGEGARGVLGVQETASEILAGALILNYFLLEGRVSRGWGKTSNGRKFS